MYTDPSGNYAVFDDIGAAVLGGLINLGVNAFQGNLSGHGFWKGVGRGFAAFGAGAVAGWGSLYPEFGGWLWGGATVGATNAWLSGGTREDIASGAFTGAIFSQFGGIVASFAHPGALWGAAYGGISSGLLGGTASVVGGGSFKDGFIYGGAFGFLGGGFSGYFSAKSAGLNPWTGRDIPSNTMHYSMPTIQTEEPQIQLPNGGRSGIMALPDEGMTPQLSPEWGMGPSPRGFAIEKIIMDEYYPHMIHLPNAPTIDGIAPNLGSVVSVKSTLNSNIQINNSLKNLADLPSSINKTLHIVTPPGYIPSNWQSVTNFCNKNNIYLILTHH
jgi:hypothetical protein